MLRSRLAAATLVGLAMCMVSAVPAAAAVPSKVPASAVHAPVTALVANGAWTVYHRDDGHTGFDSTLPAVTGASTGWVTGTMDATVYAEPLVYNGAVYAATLGNTVYAFNQSTGATLWHTNLGAPQTGGWSCGNINPTGILGTPVIDVAANRLYAVAELTGATPTYYLFGLDLANSGNIVLQTAITLAGFDWTIEQERGALAMSKDGTHVYVPFGGRAGDCGSYHGYVFGVPTDGTTALEHWQTPNTAGAGIWAAGGVVVDDGTGKVIVSTGNGGCPNVNDNFNDSVIRLTATLLLDDYFFPTDWSATWNCNDQDLGSATPVLISPTLAFQSGKAGYGFLVNPQALGGDDGQLYPTPKPAVYSPVDTCLGNHGDANFGSYAYAAPYVYLSCESNGLVALQVNTSTPSFSSCDATCAGPSWNAGGFSPGPPIVAGGAVWAVDTNGGGLYGFNAATGAQIYHSSGFGVTHFTTPSEAGGQIFVGSGNVVRSFNVVNGCSTVTLTATPSGSATTGTTVTLTATASGSGCVSPQYQFWIRPAAGSWSMVQDYSSTNTYSWTSTAVAGGYYLGVHARALGSSAPFQSLASIPYTLTSKACTSVTASAAPPSPSAPGTAVTFTGIASGCPNPLYQFWILPPGSSTWTVTQAYSTSASFNWTTAGLVGGTYRFSVWVRDTSSSGISCNSLGCNDTFVPINYRLTSVPCTSVTATAAPPTSSAAGTAVAFTGVASGCGNTALYEFWILPPGSSTWTIAQAYSTSATFSWNTSGPLPAGFYRFSVWVRDSSSSGISCNSLGCNDAFAAINHTLTSTPCTSVTASAVPATSSASGTAVVFTGVAAGCPSALYQFWILVPGSTTWVIAQAYSTSATFNWTTNGLPAGTYRFSVWVRDSSSAGTVNTSLGNFDAFVAINHTLT